MLAELDASPSEISESTCNYVLMKMCPNPLPAANWLANMQDMTKVKESNVYLIKTSGGKYRSTVAKSAHGAL